MNHKKNLFRILAVALTVIILTLAIAVLPSLFSFGRPSLRMYFVHYDTPEFKGSELYRLHFHPENFFRKPLAYFRKMGNGTFFDYYEGKTPRNFLDNAPRHLLISLHYLLPSGIISLFWGVLLSIRGADRKSPPWTFGILSFTAVVPDFILILVLQYLFFLINSMAGGELVRVSSLSMDHRALILPLFVMSCYPTLYLARTLGSRLKIMASEPYILYARAKGLSRNHIRVHHLGPAAVKLVRGDLNKLLSLLFMNLFITERMFNIKGLTAFLFSNIRQYAFTVNTLFLVLTLYVALFCLLYVLLSAASRIMERVGP